MLTVYGIETHLLQRYIFRHRKLQQCLPFTVLKQTMLLDNRQGLVPVATVLTVYGIETSVRFWNGQPDLQISCNSAYRLRY